MTKQKTQWFIHRIRKMRNKVDNQSKKTTSKQLRIEIAKYSTTIRNYNWKSTQWHGVNMMPIDRYVNNWISIMDLFAWMNPALACKMYKQLLGKKITELDLYMNKNVIHQANCHMVYYDEHTSAHRLLNKHDFDKLCVICVNQLQHSHISNP